MCFRPSTQSLRPSVYDYITENGRRFHRFRSGQYHLPNDETEQDRLDLQHHMFMFTIDDKLHLAPIEILEGGLNNVLDIGTGTGLWATEFANEYPMANVLGSDLSPIQPDFVPPNCRFEVDDVEDEWLHSYKFDYIHGRALAFCFRSHETVFGHAFNALRPGGWFEIQDVAIPMVALDETVAGTAVELWVSRLIEGGRALGRDFTRVPTYKEILEDIGYVDVVERHFHWPVGTWAKGDKMKTLGAWMREDFLSGIQGASMGVMVKGLGMTVEEVEVFLVDVRNDIWSNRIHSYFPVHVVYGRKPY
ncbi:S-adenosyl-L-methionine-dependent methyltransferase [Calycina marina]|uniref:S-adenosyl-L-methionine-dependent methyltransferase n=1 Tax=Calycina marina TaxID=1763456 RepID=A0A9P7YYQ1_9HELO|nr:S-adenosyl-L-methionine-dependent methyltransferase [Calycina marina]